MNVSKLCELYLAHAKGYYRKPKSKRLTSEYALMKLSVRPLRAVCWETDVQDMTAVTLCEARRWILDNCTTCCRRTVNAYTTRMVRVFTWGADPEQSFVPELVGARLKMLKPLPFGRSQARETDKVQPIDRDSINDLFAALASDRAQNYKITPAIKLARLRTATMVELQLETGMRPGELCAMRVEDIDRSRGDVWLYRPEEHKTDWRNKTRMIPLFDSEQFLLAQWMKLAKVEAGPVFGVKVGSYRQSIQRALKRSGLDKWAPHRLRHTAGTEARRDGGLDAAQALLGHSSSKTTEIYAELDADEIIAKMRRKKRGE